MANINTEGIVLHKRLLNHWLYKESRIHSKYEAWIYILLSAASKGVYIESFGQKYHLKRGQFATNFTNLSKEFEWSRGKVKRFLEKLQNENMLKYNISTYKRTVNGHKTDSKTLIITISKYESYNVYKKSVEHKTDSKRTNIYTSAMAVFIAFYRKNTQEDYSWNNNIDDECLKKLVNNIEKNIIAYYKKDGYDNFDVPDDMLIQKFQAFLDKVPKYYIKHSLSLDTLSKHYNKIVQNIKTSKDNEQQPKVFQGNFFENK